MGILEFLWGLGLFLFGIYYLEQAVAVFSKGGFKQLLKKFTSNTTSSVVTGIISTLIVQSSNLISVLVLAFVWTGILSLTGALAVMLGSNIGTTIPDALLGSIGLQYDIKMLTFPMLLLGAIGITFFSNKDKVVVVSKAIIALALTFLSFSLMKSGLMFLTTQVDLSMFMTMSPWIFFLVGLLLTLLVQSGGAVFIIALTSVSSGLITAEASLPIFFATYLGATITIVIASLGKQPAIKKQVAMGHVGFNLLVAGLGMLTLPWIKELLVTEGFPRWGDIRTLAIFYVAFRTMVGVLVFPFLGFFARVFQKYIIDDGLQFSLAIQKIQILPLDVELTLLAVKQDLLLYFKEVIGYNLNIRDFYLTDVSQSQENVENLFQREMNFWETYLKKKYQETKVIQEQLLNVLATMTQIEIQKAEEADQITSLYQVVIDIGDSSKYLKDVRDRVEDWQWSTSADLQKDYNTLRKMVLEFYASVLHLLAHLDDRHAFELLHNLLEKIEKNDKKYLTMFKYKEDVELTNLIQVNRYFSMSCFSLVRAVEKITLSQEDKKYLKEHIKELF